ncbi:MAG: flagellar basal body L-ring protein FlgH [Proteobacteria bacterium]|nr:flagellar basal body L-ring protein FlgH [Pseudomonadota bacterium]
MKRIALYAGASIACAFEIAGCASSAPVVAQPTRIRAPIITANLESNPGALFQPSRAMLLFEEHTASRVGDSLKISIADSLSGNSKSTATATRDSSISQQGPGALPSMGGLLKELFEYSGTASGSSNLKGNGQLNMANTLNATVMVSVIEVLPNGYLVVAGEKTLAVAGNNTTLRLSGVVNRRDIRPGNVVASNDVGEARIEQLVNGMIADTTSRNTVQRFFANLMAVW